MVEKTPCIFLSEVFHSVTGLQPFYFNLFFKKFYFFIFIYFKIRHTSIYWKTPCIFLSDVFHNHSYILYHENPGGRKGLRTAVTKVQVAGSPLPGKESCSEHLSHNTCLQQIADPTASFSEHLSHNTCLQYTTDPTTHLSALTGMVVGGKRYKYCAGWLFVHPVVNQPP